MSDVIFSSLVHNATDLRQLDLYIVSSEGYIDAGCTTCLKVVKLLKHLNVLKYLEEQLQKQVHR